MKYGDNELEAAQIFTYRPPIAKFLDAAVGLTYYNEKPVKNIVEAVEGPMNLTKVVQLAAAAMSRIAKE